MPGKSIGTALLNGYPGSVSNLADAIIAPKIASGTIPFGAPVVLAATNKVSKFGASDTLTNFLGIAVREVKQTTDYYDPSGSYKANEVADILERGAVSVYCVEGTPAPLTGVYVVTGAGTNVAIGDIVATASPAGGATTVQLTNCRWRNTSIDSNKIADLVILNRQNA